MVINGQTRVIHPEAGTVGSPYPRGSRLHAAHRREELAELCRAGRIASASALVGDQDVLDRMGEEGDVFFLHVQAWLAREHIAGRGCYADPAVRSASARDLARVIESHATARFVCPQGCTGSVHDCDGCRACEGGEHRREAVLSLSIADTVTVMAALDFP